MLFHFVQLIMNKSHLMQDPEHSYLNVIRLYYAVMDHKELYDCLKVLYAQTGMIPTKTALCSDIRDFYLQPRTLKQVL